MNIALYQAFKAFMILRVLIILIEWMYMVYKQYYRYPIIIPNEQNLSPGEVDQRR